MQMQILDLPAASTIFNEIFSFQHHVSFVHFQGKKAKRLADIALISDKQEEKVGRDKGQPDSSNRGPAHMPQELSAVSVRPSMPRSLNMFPSIDRIPLHPTPSLL